MADIEYTAQCWGGPDHGNLVSSRFSQWRYSQTSEMWLDGPKEPPTKVFVRGTYKYDYQEDLDGGNGAHVWRWEGPGADGDTIERLRLR
jgi:hypothetical protein